MLLEHRHSPLAQPRRRRAGVGGPRVVGAVAPVPLLAPRVRRRLRPRRLRPRAAQLRRDPVAEERARAEQPRRPEDRPAGDTARYYVKVDELGRAYATGRRKTAVASVVLWPTPADRAASVRVNGMDLADFLSKKDTPPKRKAEAASASKNAKGHTVDLRGPWKDGKRVV